MRAVILLATLLLSLPCAAQYQLSRAEVDDDLQLLRHALDSIHPTKFRFQSKADYERNFNTLLRNAQDPMTDYDLYKDLQWFLAGLRDSHTGMDGTPITMPKPTVLPFLFKIREGKIILTHNLIRGVTLARGSQLHSINGLPVETILETFLGLVPCDGFNSDAAKYREIERPAFFDINMGLWFPLPEKLLLEFTEYGTNQQRYIDTWSTSMKQRLKLYERRYGPAPSANDTWNFEIDADNSIGYIQTGSYRTWALKQEFRTYYDSVFTALNKQQVQYLIVDIRGNRGGTTMAAVELARWIAPKPFIWNKQRKLINKRWPTLTKHIKTRDKKALTLPNSVFTPLPDSTFALKPEHDIFLRPFEPQPARFKGKVFLLTDEGNSSAAASLAALAKANNWATLVGQPTAGLAEGPAAGTSFFFTLPNSKLRIKIPVIFNVNAVPNPPHGLGTVPHIQVNTTIGDIIKEHDPVLEYVRNLIIGAE